MNKLAFILVLVVASMSAAAAKTYVYEAQIEGMVCAFCAYNVSKKIAALPGVQAGSVDVNLDNGRVRFLAQSAVEERQIEAVLNDTGFSLNKLQHTVTGTGELPMEQPAQQLALQFEQTEVARFEPILDAIGTLAISNDGRLWIRAPASLEIPLLKPLLAGRQTAIPVDFEANAGSKVDLKLLYTTSDD